ncbi:MAG: hypothetical protein HOC70_14720 [Gammaproteobacteria bacterium]|jgi:hypothetical protein|nr:hypothetical protein [Gammaproteobacteria bacterium]MBT4494493.1 hypothetical protein [Gammaproteobacteria bacterium]MBT7371705.1 hypothetical protein [Gammaproteobacteria bacterium]
MRYLFILLALTAQLALAKQTDEEKAFKRPLAFRMASYYESAITQSDISAAAITIDTKMQKRMFARKLEKEGILPILVTVTNQTNDPIIVDGSNPKLRSKSGESSMLKIHEMLEPLITAGKGLRTFGSVISLGMSNKMGGNLAYMIELDGNINEPLVTNLYNKSLKYTFVEAGDTAAGFVFFETRKAKGKNKTIELKIRSLDSFETRLLKIPVD